jgi:chaperonin GroES
MKIKPLGRRILAKKIEEEQRKTSGGIVLPESAKSDKVVRAKVVAVGTDEKLELKKGDEILISAPSFGGPVEVEVGEDKLLLVLEKDVLAVIES